MCIYKVYNLNLLKGGETMGFVEIMSIIGLSNLLIAFFIFKQNAKIKSLKREIILDREMFHEINDDMQKQIKELYTLIDLNDKLINWEK